MSRISTPLEKFAQGITNSFQIQADFNPEDQLKRPLQTLLEEIGQQISLRVESITETQSEKIGRPDIGVSIGQLLIGHIELKAPGKGANPNLFKGRDKEQWERFKDLPNLIYTDGNEWSLFRSGIKTGHSVHFIGNVICDGKNSINEKNAEDLFSLLRDFFYWQPISPSNPPSLAKMLAPICRLLRFNVMEALKDESSNLSSLVNDWRHYLFPEADDNTFANAYAQTITYTLLLARLDGEESITISNAVEKIHAHHAFLSDVLKVLGDKNAQQGIEMPIQLLERIIEAIDLTILKRNDKDDPWLYFYEDFLAAYDPKLRKDRGVYYTPIPVVQTQVRLIAELLEKKFNAPFSFTDEKVITLDPAIGTGTYLITAINHALQRVEKSRGVGMRKNAASQAAKNMHGFEIMVGPYTVAHLRLMQVFQAEKATIPDDGVHIYLTDTLESPNAMTLQPPFMYKGWEREHSRALKIKKSSPILVCLGNPPYDRQQRDPDDISIERKGGWVRFGESGSKALLDDFVSPLTELGLGRHAQNLYNDYVYFWRWAIWKVIENNKQGIVSFITASSYLRGPGFSIMRQFMRQAFDDIWIIDLEGDNLGARKTENVFEIQSPVAIAICVRYQEEKQNPIAKVRYSKLEGTQLEKLEKLNNINSFEDVKLISKNGWEPCLDGKTDPFLPISQKYYWNYPLLTDIFPWQENGIKVGRTWPIAVDKNVLMKRWRKLLNSDEKKILFKDSPTGRKINKSAPAIPPQNGSLPPISKLGKDTPVPNIIEIAYRSFDRQWLLTDGRLIDRPSPNLWRSHSPSQLYLTSFLTNVIGEGPSAIITSLIPDLDHFRGSFGAKHVIPLWQNVDGNLPNITNGFINVLQNGLKIDISAEDFFAYTYGLLFSPLYAAQFWNELTIPGIRLPITKDSSLFTNTVKLGKKLIFLHTFAKRFVPEGEIFGQIPQGMARCKVGTPANRDDYPENYHYDEITQELTIGKGVFNFVRPQIWNFSISGFQVIKSWLGYRMKNRSGRKSSELDNISPEIWTFDNELLDLLWTLDNTIDLLPQVNENFLNVVNHRLFDANNFPKPSASETHSKNNLSLFDFAGIEIDQESDVNGDSTQK